MDEKTWKKLRALQEEIPYATPKRAARLATEINEIALREMRLRRKR